MRLIELREIINNRNAKLAVIGLGYVGLPVACRFTEAGFDLIGVDVNRDRLIDIQAGTLPFSGHEPGLADLLSTVIVHKKFIATSDYSLLTDRDVILVCVETPVDDAHIPQYQALRSALSALGPVLKSGALVIIESTLAPGTMQNLVLPLLEQSSATQVNEGFYLGVCPERVMPGKLLKNLKSVSRVVGGMTPETTETIVLLYRAIVEAELDMTDCVTAELVKTVENAYRDVQIAFANEVALICSAVGGDVWAVRSLVNKSPGRQMLLPGAGVGGHCIPKDPWLLAYAVIDKDTPLQLIPAARSVNNSMPGEVLGMVEEALALRGLGISGARILIMGYAYLEESDDTRNSPSEILVKRLIELGADPVIHDPFVREYQGQPLELAIGCDAVILMVSHKVYRTLDLQNLRQSLRTPILVDGRGLFQPSNVRSVGLDYWGIGGRSPTMKKILLIVGARPQFIKAAPIINELRGRYPYKLLHTGQHYDENMSAIFFSELGIPEADVNLGIHIEGRGAQISAMLTGVESVITREQPDWVLVFGDTNSTLAGALASTTNGVQLAHLEAGLRSYNRQMPEEVNRVLTDHISNLLFCPSQTAVDNLAKEGITKNVHLVGELMMDMLRITRERAVESSRILAQLELVEKGFLLVTFHRAENTQDNARLEALVKALLNIQEPVVFPLHPGTRKILNQRGLFDNLQGGKGTNLRVIEPLGYLDMVGLVSSARMVLTDSGGLQKEAYWLGVPCVTLRDETEWVETIQAGWNMLVGTDIEKIVHAVQSFNPPSRRPSLYGDGYTARRCIEIMQAS